MRNLKSMLVLGMVFAMSVVCAVDPEEMADKALQTRYRSLTHELRCMQCQNQSIADSPVGLAGDLRREVRELLAQGKSDTEIRDWMRLRYGAFILFRPQFSPSTAWLWLSPGLMLVAGSIIGLRILRQRRLLEPFEPDDSDDNQ